MTAVMEEWSAQIYAVVNHGRQVHVWVRSRATALNVSSLKTTAVLSRLCPLSPPSLQSGALTLFPVSPTGGRRSWKLWQDHKSDGEARAEEATPEPAEQNKRRDRTGASVGLEYELPGWVFWVSRNPVRCSEFAEDSFSSQSAESSSSDSDDDLQRNGYALNGSSTAAGQPQRRRDSDVSSSGSRPPPPTQIGRSRSPIVKSLDPGLATFSSRRPASPNVPIRRVHIQPIAYRYLLPSTFAITLPGTRRVRKITGDFRKAGENIILLVSLLLGMQQIWNDSETENGWLVIGKYRTILSCSWLLTRKQSLAHLSFFQ